MIPTDRIALAATHLLAGRFGSNRERATSALAEEAAERLSAGPWRQWPDGERLWWERWAPLVGLLGPEAWTPEERASLVEVIRAKGGRREAAYVARFDAHTRLPQALVGVARQRPAV